MNTASVEKTKPPTERKIPWRHFIGIAVLLVMLALPLLPAPLALPEFRLALLGRFACYAILAIGLDLIWGYTGILSLGHGVYFGLGAYCTAMYLKLEASGGKMPDFMAWSGVDKMPIFWEPFRSPVFAIVASILVPTILAGLLGYFTFRSRVRGVFFSILSQALALVVVTFFVGQQGYTGGTNGMTNFKTFMGIDLNSNSTQRNLYWLSFIALAGVYLLSRHLISGRIGKLLIAIRDGENRVRFTGYDPTAYKVFVYALSAAFAGLAGMLFVLQIGLITPTEMDITHSIRMVLWVALGGRSTLIGAIIGAFVVNGAENLLSETYPAVWSLLMGGAFLLFVLFLPNGIVGLWNDMSKKIMGRRWKNGLDRTPAAEPLAGVEHA